ncbi:MAG: DUF2147 domain-containing protein [Helicobacteraceae bacterium]|nr:DUF2147 domain-containing protein [Helicobacteraceae bacterium]
MKILLISLLLLSLEANNDTTLKTKQEKCRNDIIGYWLSPKDKHSGRVNIIEFIKKGGKYFAYNVIFMDMLPSQKDENNQKYSLRDREILGSVYIYDLQKNTKNSYTNGRYYDFNNGKIFQLKARLECNKLKLLISVDNIGMLGISKVYEYLNPNDIEFYIKGKKPHIDFSGVEQ